MIRTIAPGTTIEARYVADEGNFSRYRFSVNGTDVVDALIDNSDPRLEINVVKSHGALTERVGTNGVARRSAHELPSTDGSGIPDGLSVHIDGLSVYSYVVPRLLRIITALHVTAVTGTSYR